MSTPNKHPVGIMQGRLSAPSRGRIQSFPVDTWRKEFDLARQAGIACIEWIYETETDHGNPLRTTEGIDLMRQATATTGVGVFSICADYYMGDRLIDPQGNLRESTVTHLEWLIGQAAHLTIRYMVLPFVDASSLRTPAERSGLFKLLERVLPAAERANLELHLETDLPPAELATIYKTVPHARLKANYDIGNSAALGFDPQEELAVIGSRLGSVHVKDRIKGGGTVPLGNGSANLPLCFRLILDAGFKGPFILQVARQEGVSETDLAIRNRRFVEDMIASLS